MKQIVNGLTYNTETAKELAHIWNGIGYGELKHYQESLYETKKGGLFLHISGGAMTSMAVDCGNNTTSGSSDIRPVTTEEAVKWYLENNQDISLNIEESEFHHIIGYQEVLA